MEPDNKNFEQNEQKEVTYDDVLKAAEEKTKAQEEAWEAKVKAEEDASALKEAEKKLKEAEEKAAQYLDQYQRTLAEFDNFRKRTLKEKASMYDDGVMSAAEKLLPVLDNLERAVAAGGDPEDSFFKGVKMTLDQLNDTLKSLGVEEIKAVGEKFDPALHSAVAHVEDPAYGENEIISDMQKGYKYKNKVIRPSMVKVAN